MADQETDKPKEEDMMPLTVEHENEIASQLADALEDHIKLDGEAWASFVAKLARKYKWTPEEHEFAFKHIRWSLIDERDGRDLLQRLY